MCQTGRAFYGKSLNTTVQQSTGFSPIRLLIGRNSNIPCIQAQLDEIVQNDDEIIDVTADRQLAHQRLKIVAGKFKDRFDQTRRDNINYSVGDTVYVNQDHRRHDKLRAKFKGPYEIMSILDNDRFLLRGIGNLRNITVAKEKFAYGLEYGLKKTLFHEIYYNYFKV